MGKGKRYKKEFGYSYSFGVYPTLELFKYHPEEVLEVFISSKGFENTGVEKIQAEAEKRNIKVETSDGLVESVTGNENSYAVGIFRKYESPIIEGNQVVLLSPEDAGNLGTIIRTMIAFGCFNLAIIKPAVDIWDPKVIRASMGAVFQVNFSYFGSFEEYRKKFPSQSNYVLTSSGNKKLRETQFQKPASLVFGPESAGVTREIMSKGETVAIPFEKTIESLPLPIAVATVLYKIYENE